ncbi:hypothetical protein G4B11_010237 [Aspergillus flavus]|nr:hypothetical protein G4B11_010237 [Aspergillus flavus]
MAPPSSPPTKPASYIDQGLEGTRSFDGVEEAEVLVPMTQTVAIITSITCITGIGNLLAGLHTVVPARLSAWWIASDRQRPGAGLSATGTQLIALQVIPAPSQHHLRGHGGGRAVGFGLGLALGGVFSDTIGWHWGFFVTAILNSAVLALALWAILKSADGGPLGKASLTRVHRDVDWIGALLISACLAFLYELAVATGSDADQTVCITVFLVWGTLNASEQLTVLYLQDVRGTSTLTASLYFMPAPVCGLLMNAAIGLSFPYLKSSIAVPAGCLLSGIAPLLLATLCGVDGPGYWRGVFQAMALNSLGADLVYTIAKLVITDSFPAKTQALAGGVFNMLAQVVKSVGIATSALIARQITSQMDHAESATAMLKGYEAGWWYNCGLGFVSVAVSFGGMRSVKVIEIKRD